jgi:hypothetical protein
MTTFSIVCATKNPKYNSETLQQNYVKWELSLARLSKEFIFNSHIYYDNIQGLSSIYNDSFEHIDTDYIICIHDDVVVNDLDIFSKIKKYSQEFDIMGVAGGCNFSFKRHARLSWMSVLNQQTDLAGAVQHRMSKEGEPEVFSTCCYGAYPRKVFSIDGLIMIFNKKAYKTVRFDPQFEFDFYDLDLCFNAYKQQLKVGVIPLSVTHYSKGEGILKDSYLVAQQKFINKYNGK